MTEIFEPVSDKLICTPVEQDETSAGGIYLPQIDEQKSLKAKVLHAGPGFWAAPGLFIETTIKPGDVIVYQRFSAQIFEYEGTDYHIVQERDVLTKIKQ